MTAATSVRNVTLDSDWLPHAFTPDGRQLTFVFVPPDARRSLLFLTEGHLRDNYQRATLATDAVASAVGAAAQAPLHFIFNTSFCCSTLLANALAVRGTASTLKEPNILVNVAERAIGQGLAQIQTEIELALRLLERPLGADEAVIVKPSNFANRLLEPVLASRPGSRAVLLYSDAGTLLRSILKRGLLARINARKLYQNLVAWTALDLGFGHDELFQQTDLQIAALAWLMQMAEFQRVADRRGPQRVMFIDASDLLAEPQATIERIQSFFGVGLDERQIAAIAAGPVFSKHSKFADVDYDKSSREREHDEISKVHAEELQMVLQWLDAVAAHCGVDMQPAGRPRAR